MICMKIILHAANQLSLVVLLLYTSVTTAAPSGEVVDFSEDILPILSNNCYQCHGPDEAARESDLRLDTQQGVYEQLESGEHAVVPGKPNSSALLHRIFSDDPDLKMPPSDAKRQLTQHDKELLQRWIKQGAHYQGHWAFTAPQQVEPPRVHNRKQVANPIDSFLLNKLEQQRLNFEPIVAPETLIRRLTLDLTGLPPTIAEVDAFLGDEKPGAYDRLITRLFKSPHYGEHMARFWLDAARYGDTHGLHLDNIRSIWPYRDWVINAFSNNMPFDQFTVEQLAGDLLPMPTLDQRVATGFNRCNVTTSEGGSIAAEYLVRYAVDRVETTSTVWMGLTLGCAVCHEHKFDPISQQEFYQLFSYFYSLTEKAMDGNALLPPPVVQVPSEQQSKKIAQLESEIQQWEGKLQQAIANFEYQDVPVVGTEHEIVERGDYVWFDDTPPTGAKLNQSGHPWKYVTAPEYPVFHGERATHRAEKGLTQHLWQDAPEPLKIGKDDILFAYVYLDPKNPPQEIMLQFNESNSWEHRALWGDNLIDWGNVNTPSRLRIGDLPETGKWIRLEVDASKVGLQPGSRVTGWAFTQFGGSAYWDYAGINTLTVQAKTEFKSQRAWEFVQHAGDISKLSVAVQAALKIKATDRNANQVSELRSYFLTHVYVESRKLITPFRHEVDMRRQRIADIQKQVVSTLVMEDMPKKRQAYLLIRGDYTKPGVAVESGVPEILPALPAAAPNNRLALARWLVSPEHPLTARVIVNRFWQQLFGVGIVKTSEDFGVQGERPVHPELLDWLAVKFQASGWDVQYLMKLLVTSHAYRQSSFISEKKHQLDPENRLLAHGPRFRMDAEMIRDVALFHSRLLVDTVGGPSVKPYQPAGIWKAVGYSGSNTVKFTRDNGEKLYRRSMYTFWKRTAPPPSMQIFDAPSREFCAVRRSRTNTPMQALVLMNDEQFVEAARQFGRRMLTTGGESDRDKLVFGFRSVTSRFPTTKELNILVAVLEDHRQRYQEDQEAAQQLIHIGASAVDEILDAQELASWTMIGNLLLNLNETITKN
jgi:hypothetical protein